MALEAQEDLAAGIARELELEGTCVRLVSSIPAQQVVDVRWAAKRAGRMIGKHVQTSVTKLSERPYADVAVVATVDPESPSA
jgi:hypothetical protein